MKKQTVLALISATLLLAAPTEAAEMTFQHISREGTFSVAEFRLEGEIGEADVENAQAALAKADLVNRPGEWQDIVVSLNSEGGSYKGALDLALF